MVHKVPDASKVALLGAFDRFNYGDLLFPIVVKNEIAIHSPETESSVFALIESDLSSFGALKTSALKTLFRPGVLNSGDAVIFAGGGTIGVDWTYMHSNLLGPLGNGILYYLKRTLGDNTTNWISRRYFGARAPFPWVAGPQDFPVPVSIAYNAIGGSEFAQLSPLVQARTIARLRKATYISVRDAETKRLFQSVEDSVAVHLAPDSAILMSEQFPIHWLEREASSNIGALLDEGPYVCFQSNISYATENLDLIAVTLERVFERYGLRAVLLPIGRYVGLDDHVAIRGIKEKLRTPSQVISDKTSIWEIMLVIARAKLFLGTSLHGNVTSQSYAVPHLGLSDKIDKVDHYLRTWDLPEQRECVPLVGLLEQVERVLVVSESTRQLKRSELISLSHQNFARMASACGLGWN